ncbi:Na+/H+ antiporter NhaC [Bacillus oleivorans]|uniref:Na+/H+ antiporter NhaC n=1 Tax=Bacillus oleivorans TaxID=1448271 RepID=A0A285D7E7_9BACI|nr:Na+/H+ antiporter NhaC family protein [Bacillus oleivorans]SNX75276.1 Na+/H+ antiporter NhaC [Bacillus oleivorans]
MTSSIFSLLPPILAIIMVLITKRVLLSLGIGIVSAAFLLAIDAADGFGAVAAESLSIIWTSFSSIFYAEGELNTWYVYILLFIVLLGMITAFILVSGGSRAFGEWALSKVKTRKGAQVMTAIFGILIFIDDYFNSLAVGQVSRPITDRHRVSRAKLAYLIDSTAAPVCVVSPVSSWGAYIVAAIATILADNEITGFTAFSAYLGTIPMNFYVWVTLAIVFIIAIRQTDFGPMRVHEQRAIETGEVFDPEKPIPGEVKQDLPVNQRGTVADLILPIIGLVIGTVGAMIWTGYQTAGTADIFAVFENTDVALSLLVGGLVGLAVTLILFFIHAGKKNVQGKTAIPVILEGIKSMLPAVYILVFAWIIAALIGKLQTGEYLAAVVEDLNISVGLLPVIIFIIAGIMAFATGSSWGSFGILLPIAGEIASATSVEILIPTFAAVLAGSVLGDHSSPISDTTILSSTGAASNHLDHFATQLPYVLVAGVISALGFLVLGLTGSTVLGLLTCAVLLIVLLFILPKPIQTKQNAIEQ